MQNYSHDNASWSIRKGKDFFIRLSLSTTAASRSGGGLMSEGGSQTARDQRISCLIRAEHKHVRIGLLALLDHIVFWQLSEFIADFSAQLRDQDLEHHDFESLNDIITVDESLLQGLESIAIFFDQDIFITLVHLKLKVNKTSLFILKHI
jgi:hypothetical protein